MPRPGDQCPRGAQNAHHLGSLPVVCDYEQDVCTYLLPLTLRYVHSLLTHRLETCPDYESGSVLKQSAIRPTFIQGHPLVAIAAPAASSLGKFDLIIHWMTVTFVVTLPRTVVRRSTLRVDTPCRPPSSYRGEATADHPTVGQRRRTLPNIS